MNAETVILQVPEALYRQLKQRADQAQRSVAAELLDRVVATAPEFDLLPDELEAALASLRVLDDAALWQAAQSRFAAKDAAELEGLHHKRQRVGLSDVEQQRSEALVQQYERAMLVRAQAAVLLRERGHDVEGLVASGSAARS